MKRKKLTFKQERYCLAYVTHAGNQTAAYRAAYDCRKSNDHTAANEAYRLMKNPEVTQKIQKIQQSIESKVIEDRIWVLSQLVEVVEEYKANRQNTSAALKAINSICKMQGYYVKPEKPKPQVCSAVILYDPETVNNNDLIMFGGEYGI